MKILLVYYSYSGHTKQIASKLKAQLGCDMAKLVVI